MRFSIRASLLAVLFTCISLIGFGQNSPTTVSVTVTPATSTVLTGTTEQLTATATLSNGTKQVVTSHATWASLNTSVAVVNDAGVVTPIAPGTDSIIVTYGAVQSRPVTITVSGESTTSVVSVSIAGLQSTLLVGNDPVQLQAAGTLGNGSISNVTSSATWNTSDGSVATVSQGLVTPVSTGTVAITATMNGITSAPLTLSIVVGGTNTSGGVTPAGSQFAIQYKLSDDTLGGLLLDGPFCGNGSASVPAVCTQGQLEGVLGNAFDTYGAAAAAQTAAEAASDPTGSASAARTAAETYASNASNLASGTVAPARLPAATPTAQGGVQLPTGASGNTLGSAAMQPTTAFDAAGAAAAAQSAAEAASDPAGSATTAKNAAEAASDASGAAAAAQTAAEAFAANASNLNSGSIAAARLPAATPTAQGAVVLPTGASGNTLGSAAMQAASAFDNAGAASAAQTAAIAAAEIYAVNTANQSAGSYAIGGGTAQAQTVTLSPVVASLTPGLIVRWKPLLANTAAAPTLAVNGLTATTITKCGGSALVAGDLSTTAIAFGEYDGTSIELIDPQAASCGSSGGGSAGGSVNAFQYSNGSGGFLGASITGPVCGNGTSSAPAACNSTQMQSAIGAGVYDASGAASAAQSAAEAASDANGAASTAQTNAEAYAANASNIASGTLGAARLPAATPSVQGAVILPTGASGNTLGTAAMQAISAFDAAGAASAAQTAAISAAEIYAVNTANQSAGSYAAGGGTAQAQTVTLSPVVPSLTPGLIVRWKPLLANTAAAPTLAINGLAATSITKCGGSALVAGDLSTTAIAVGQYDGSAIELLDPQAASCGSSGSGSAGGSVYAFQYSNGSGGFLGASINGPACGNTTSAAPAACTSSQMQTAIGASVYDAYGAATTAQSAAEAASDPSGSATTAQTNAEAYAANASNLASGTVAAARLPAASPSAQGAVQLPTGASGNTLGSAAMQPTTAFDAAGAAAAKAAPANCTAGTFGTGTTTSGITCAALSATNAQSATYQMLATDFSGYKTITVASGTFTMTLVASGSQPAAGQYVYVINYGTGVVTIARSGQNINGGTTSLTIPAGSATAPTGALIDSDGTNYEAVLFGASSGGGGQASVTIPVAYSATPTFTCTSNTVNIFTMTLTGNVTSSTLASCPSGALVGFIYTQDSTGSRTVVPPSGFTTATSPYPAASTTTSQMFSWNGTNGAPTGPAQISGSSLSGFWYGSLGAAPSGNPPSGYLEIWMDTTNSNLLAKNSSGTIFQMEQQLTGIRYGNGTGADTAATGAQLSAALGSTAIAPATLGTATNCAANGTAANPSVVSCSAAPVGRFSCATNASTGTCVVDTTAVTANSVIQIQPDSTLGTALSVTCNTTADSGVTVPRVSARNPLVSFTITLGTFTTNPECFTYIVVN